MTIIERIVFATTVCAVWIVIIGDLVDLTGVRAETAKAPDRHMSLILHDLVTTSIKHAFSKGKKGSIRLSLEALGNEAILTYSDSGPGLSKKQDLGKSKSVGMKLITLLTGQLKGEL